MGQKPNYERIYREHREDEEGGRWCVVVLLGCLAGLLLLTVLAMVTCATPARADELVREGRYAVLDDAGAVVSEHNELHVAIIAAQAWSRTHDGRTARIEPPRYRVVVDPPPPPEMAPEVAPEVGGGASGGAEVPPPGRVVRGAVKNESAEGFVVDRPTRVVQGVTEPTMGAWYDAPGSYRLADGVIRGYGGVGDVWGHGVYARGVELAVDRLMIHAPVRVEAQGRDHAMYLVDTALDAGTLLIGAPGDEVAHDLDVKIKTLPGSEPRSVAIDTLVVVGGRRVVLTSGNDPGNESRVSAASIHIRRLVVIDPVGAPVPSGALWEGVEVEGCPDLVIDEYLVIDRAGRITRGQLVKATASAGRVGVARVYAPNLAHDRDPIAGIDGEVEWLAAPPAGAMPAVTGPASAGALAAWAETAEPKPTLPPAKSGGVPRVNLDGGLREVLVTCAAKAAEVYAAAEGDPTYPASCWADTLIILLSAVADQQRVNHGGLPWVTGSTIPAYNAPTRHEDGTCATMVQTLLAVDAIVRGAGGKLAERVDAAIDLRAAARALLDNAEQTFDAIGYIPPAVDPADPTRTAQGRPFMPRWAADTRGTAWLVNACVHYQTATGEVHPLAAKLVTALREYRAAFPADMPAYIERDGAGGWRGVYGSLDGTIGTDPALGKPGFDWSHDGVTIDNQIRRGEGMTR